MADFRSSLETIERELAELERRRDELDRAVARLRRIRSWLRRRSASPAAGGASRPSRSPSLTDGCRAVLRMSAPAGLTPREVRKLLTAGGFEWGRYSSPMSAVHTVLKRLVQQREAVAAIDRDGHRRFAVPRRAAVAMTRAEIDDAELVAELLETDSLEAALEVLAKRRSVR